MSVSRRRFLNAAPVIFAPALWAPLHAQAPTPARALAGARPTGPVTESFPTQPPELVREMVTVSHGNLARVKELVTLHPTLARAAWDWGFGDWEDALGAASHVGNRDIAEILLANGARPTIFSAAMLGQLEVVKAFVAASPGVEATPGPHSIPLLRHATAGGARARAVVEYLQTLPGADQRPATQPISADDLSALTGDYVFGSGPDERIVIALSTNGSLTFQRTGRMVRDLGHVGDRVFYPAGAPRVQIRFQSASAGVTLTVVDGDLLLEARRTRGQLRARG